MTEIPPDALKEKMRILRLNDMAGILDAALEDAETQRQGYLAFLDRLFSTQLQARNARSLERRIKNARLPPHMTFENFDWNFQPTLNVEYVKDLMELGFIPQSRPLLILGSTGAGKTHLATAFGIRACNAGYRVEFHTLQALLGELYATLADDTTDEILARIARLDLLIIDHVTYIRSKPEYPSLLLDLVNTCQHCVSLTVTSNISFQQWGEAIGNPSVVNAIVDRLFDKACLINIHQGKSYRTQGPHAPSLVTSEHPTTT